MNKKITLIIIVILIILVIIVLLSANKLIKANKLEYYHENEKEMIEASEDYFRDYINYLPKEVGSKTRVLLSALVIEEYIEMIKDINNNDCNSNKSYVEVEKTSDEEFLYKAHLVCDNDNYETKDGE